MGKGNTTIIRLRHQTIGNNSAGSTPSAIYRIWILINSLQSCTYASRSDENIDRARCTTKKVQEHQTSFLRIMCSWESHQNTMAITHLQQQWRCVKTYNTWWARVSRSAHTTDPIPYRPIDRRSDHQEIYMCDSICRHILRISIRMGTKIHSKRGNPRRQTSILDPCQIQWNHHMTLSCW